MTSPDHSACPHLDELVGLVEERLDPNREQELTAHLDRCDRCRQRLEAVAAEGGFEAAINAAASRTIPRSGPLDTAIDLLKAATPVGQPPAAEAPCSYADLLPWIEPSARGIGQVGGYRLTRFLGRGAMGVVFAGHEETLDRPVAIKFLNPVLAARREFRERFLREARAIAAINHPHVVTILAVAEAQGLPYLVMERFEGVSLEAMLADQAAGRRSPLSAAEIAGIARQLAAGMRAAHTAGLLHQDVKPANVLISPDAAVVKLTDFGLARSLTEATSDRLAGTPGYVSPEVLAGEKPDPRSDLFGLGCVLRELAAGRPPIAPDGGRGLDVDSPRQPAAGAASGSTGLAAIIERLLAADPADRFQSAAEVERAVAAADAATVPNRQTGRTANSKPAWPRRQLILAGLGAAVAVAGLFLLRRPKDSDSFTAEDLAAAIETAAAGDVITIPGDGIFELDAFDLGSRDLTIRGDGSRPVLRFVAGEEATGRSLFASEGNLTLEGISLELALAGDADPEQAWCLITLDGGSLRLDDCSLEVAGESGCITALESPRLEILDSSLHAPAGTAIDWTPASGGEAAVERSIISGQTAWAIADPSDATLSLDRVTCVVDRLITLRWDEFESPADGRLTIEAASSVVAAGEALLLLHTDAIDEEVLQAAVGFEGRANLLDGTAILLDREAGRHPPGWLTGAEAAGLLADLAGESGLAGEIRFAGDRRMLRDWPNAAEGDIADSFALEPAPGLRDRFGDDPPGGIPRWR